MQLSVGVHYADTKITGETVFANSCYIIIMAEGRTEVGGKQQRANGANLFLDSYIAKGESIHKSFGDKEYEIELFQGKHEEEYSVYELKNGEKAVPTNR